MNVKRKQEILEQLQSPSVPMGTIKKIAKEIKVDNEFAVELWNSKQFYMRMLSILIMDKSLITQDSIELMAKDVKVHNEKERNQIGDWFLANQLLKSSKTKKMILTWQSHASPLLRRLFWYHQARLRWTGKIPIDNAVELIGIVENEILSEEPEVQWAMNFCIAWIGIHDKSYRQRCIDIGLTTKLYEKEKAPKGCTPNYLPEFIRIESSKITNKNSG